MTKRGARTRKAGVHHLSQLLQVSGDDCIDGILEDRVKPCFTRPQDLIPAAESIFPGDDPLSILKREVSSQDVALAGSDKLGSQLLI